MDKYLFEIAIYRTSPSNYYSEMDTAKQIYLDKLHISSEKNPETYRVAEQYFDREIWSPWYFNQAIGWFQLYVFGTSIRVEYYFINAERISKFVKYKRFLWQGKAFELNPSNSESSKDIYENIRDNFRNLNSEKPFKGRYIDIEKFENVGPHLNWRTILSFE